MKPYFPLDINLTESQKRVLEAEPNLIVYGPAGSGKTLLSILLAEKLTKENTKVNVEIIVFTKSLSAFIEIALKQRNIQRTTIRHYISLEHSYYDVDYSIIDEAQDFSMQQIEVIRNRTTTGLYLLADPHQVIYNFQDLPKEIKSEYKKLEFQEIVLNEVVRYNAGIHNFISRAYPETASYSVTDKNIIKPQIHKCDSLEDEIRKIIKLIEKQRLHGNIGILVALNQSIDDLRQLFARVNFSVDGYKFKSDEHLDFDEGKVNLLTYHSAKGLEFDTVILPFFEGGHGFNKNFYYVGFSRAKKHLFIFYLNSFPADIVIEDLDVYEGLIEKPDVFEGAKLQLSRYCYMRDFYRQNNIEEDSNLKSIRDESIREAKEILKYASLNETEINKWILNELAK